MAVRLGPLLPRIGVLAALVLGASATLTWAAAGTLSPSQPSSSATAAPAVPLTLVVPDVQNQAFVFAKGILEDGGFAWRVTGSVQGYNTNLVASQSPAPGTKVIDTGSPTITVVLVRNPRYKEQGDPEDTAPYAGTALELAAAAASATKPAAKHELAPTQNSTTQSSTTQATTTQSTTTASKPAAKPAAKHSDWPAKRPPAFAVAEAPKEPLDEMPLTNRARVLGTWLTAHRKPTNANVRHLLYQHAWIVTGAKFGWWHGAAALKLLIAVDRRTQQLWGIGARNERIARAALAEVEKGSR